MKVCFNYDVSEVNKMGMTARIQVLPNGLIVGHVVPVEHPANGTVDLEENKVYELQVDPIFGTQTFVHVGEADFKVSDVEPGGCSIDKFIAESGGKHLTVRNGK